MTVSETTKSTSVASYLDLLFTRDESNNIATKLYDKRGAFGFHIVNFTFLSSNIPSAPTYGVYASQPIRYAHCCSNFSDFLSHHRVLVTRYQDKKPPDKNPPDINPWTKTPWTKTPQTKTPQRKLMNTKYILHK